MSLPSQLVPFDPFKAQAIAWMSQAASAIAALEAGMVIEKATTGDPATGEEGQVCINSFDHNVKIYAESTWQTIYPITHPVPVDSPTFTTQITAPVVYGSAADNGDLTLEGTSSGTKATSYVNLQPTSGNVGVNTDTPTHALDVNANTLRLRTARTPASRNAAGVPGEICWDSGNIYVCIANNSWKRVAINIW